MLTRSGNTFTGENDVYCTGSITTTSSEVEIDRSRYYGWEDMAYKVKDVHDTHGLNLSVTYNCAGTGTHDFRTATDSFILYNGTWYEEQNTDEIDNQTC